MQRIDVVKIILLDPTSWSMKEVIARRTWQPDYIAVTLSLSRGILTLGLLCTWPGNGPSLMRRNPRDSGELSSG